MRLYKNEQKTKGDKKATNMKNTKQNQRKLEK